MLPGSVWVIAMLHVISRDILPGPRTLLWILKRLRRSWNRVAWPPTRCKAFLPPDWPFRQTWTNWSDRNLIGSLLNKDVGQEELKGRDFARFHETRQLALMLCRVGRSIPACSKYGLSKDYDRQIIITQIYQPRR